MDDDRITWLWRCLEAAWSRRTTLGAGVAALTALGLDAGGAQILAKKKRKKKRKKKKPEPPCSELCGFDCIRCYYRADAPPLCGDNGGTTCVSCRSDNDCVGEAEPYCVTRFVQRSTGLVSQICGTDGSCNCAPGALGACTSVNACNP